MEFIHTILNALHSKQDVGYCQGMSHVAALLLMYMSEEVRAPRIGRLFFHDDVFFSFQQDAFWALSVLMSHPRFAMHGLFVPGFPKLKRFHSHVDAILTKFLPRVRKHLVDDIGVPLDLVSVKWFLQCFLDRVPFTLALRIYDIYLLEGERLLIAFSYTLYRMHRRILLKLKSLEEAMEFLQNRIAVDGGGLSDDALIDALRVSNAELRKHKFDIPKQAATAEERPTKAFGLTYNKVLSVGDARAHVARTPQTGAMKNGSPPPFSPSLTGGNSQTSDSRLSVRSDQTAVSAELGTGPDSTPKPISRLPHDPERANAPPALVNGERGDDVDGSDIVDTSLGTMLATGGGPPPSRVRRRLPARPPGHQHMHQPSVSFADDVVIDSNTPRHSRQSPVFGKHVTRIDIRPQVSPRASTAPAVLPPNGPMPPSGRVSSRFIPMAELQQQQNDYYRGATLPQQQQQYPTAFGPHDAPLSVPYFATGSGSLPSPFDFTRSPSAPGNAYATPMGQPTYEYDLTLPTLGSNHQYSPHSLPPRFDAVNSIAPQQQMLPPHHYYPAPPPPPAYDPRFVGAPLHDGIGVYSRDREECFDEEEELEDDLVDELNGGTDGYAHPSPQPPAHLSTTARGATVIRIG